MHGGEALVSALYVWLVLFTLPSGVLWAEQRPGTDALRQAAELMRAGQCEQAIPLLREAVRLGGHRNAQWNIAECFASLDRPGLAIEAYQDYLEHEVTQQRPRDAAAARAAIARLEPGVARVAILCEVDGATVRVDGQEVGRIGDAPLIVHVGPGLRTIEVTASGYQSLARQLELEAGEDREFEAPLEVEPGELTVSSEPGGAEFSVDGEPRGVTTGTVEVTGGNHVVEVRLDGYRVGQRQVTVRAGRSASVNVPLTPLGGTLSVASDVSDATLEVNGEERGTSPFVPLALSPGRYQLEVEASRHASWSGDVDVLDGRSTVVEVELSASSGLNQGWFWGTSVLSVAGVASGIVMLLRGLRDGNQFNSIVNSIDNGGEGTRRLWDLQTESERLADDAIRNVVIGAVLLGVGGLAMIASIVLGLRTRFRRAESSAEVRVTEAEELQPEIPPHEEGAP